MPQKTYIQAIRDGIREEMQRDERVMILGEDVGAKGGVFGVTEGPLYEEITRNILRSINALPHT